MAAQELQHLRLKARSIAKFQRKTSRSVAAGIAEEFVDALEIRVRRAKVRGKLEQDRSQFLLQSVDAFQETVPRLSSIAQPPDVSDVARRFDCESELAGCLIVPSRARFFRWQPIERVIYFD